MKDRAARMKLVFRGIARVQKAFSFQLGPLRATGIPAILLGVGGVVLASGLASALSKSAPRLPETLGEARGLAEAMNARLRLKS